VFTARYALSPYIKQTGFVFKGLTIRPFDTMPLPDGIVKGKVALVHAMKAASGSEGITPHTLNVGTRRR
jgi:hypothetical protein